MPSVQIEHTHTLLCFSLQRYCIFPVNVRIQSTHHQCYSNGTLKKKKGASYPSFHESNLILKTCT